MSPYLAQGLLVCGMCYESPLWLLSVALPRFPPQAARHPFSLFLLLFLLPVL